MKASSLCFKSAVVFALAGMAMGIGMAASHDHSVAPAHAHLNLLGWVSLFLIGIYYRFNPALDVSRAALIQVGGWVVATVIMTSGITAIYLGRVGFGEPIATVGSLLILVDMLFFAILVFRPAPKGRAAEWAPAE
jgi:hypothetical protein